MRGASASLHHVSATRRGSAGLGTRKREQPLRERRTMRVITAPYSSSSADKRRVGIERWRASRVHNQWFSANNGDPAPADRRRLILSLFLHEPVSSSSGIPASTAQWWWSSPDNAIDLRVVGLATKSCGAASHLMASTIEYETSTVYESPGVSYRD